MKHLFVFNLSSLAKVLKFNGKIETIIRYGVTEIKYADLVFTTKTSYNSTRRYSQKTMYKYELQINLGRTCTKK